MLSMVLSYADNSEVGGSETYAIGSKLLIITKYAPPPKKKKKTMKGAEYFFQTLAYPTRPQQLTTVKFAFKLNQQIL